MGEATASMTAAVDGAMARRRSGRRATRVRSRGAGRRVLAAIEQSRAALDQAGEEAARNLGQRLDTIGAKIEALCLANYRCPDTASHALVTGLSKELTDLDQWFAPAWPHRHASRANS